MMALVLQFWDFYWDFGNFYREINHKQVSLQFLHGGGALALWHCSRGLS